MRHLVAVPHQMLLLHAGTTVDLGMRVRLVHGDEVISDSEADGGLVAACSTFKEWVHKKYSIKP